MEDYSSEIAEINNSVRINRMRDMDNKEMELRNRRNRDRMERKMWMDVLDVLCYIEDGDYRIKLHQGMDEFEEYLIQIRDANVDILPHDYANYIREGEKPYVNIVSINNSMDSIIEQIRTQVSLN